MALSELLWQHGLSLSNFVVGVASNPDLVRGLVVVGCLRGSQGRLSVLQHVLGEVHNLLWVDYH